ncbi:hypothetical protein FRC09_020817 [Ceratobasidium sp. 395]|nr:hypothetical protein FRC09_020817 [Ceratobasidium sp. 395]
MRPSLYSALVYAGFAALVSSSDPFSLPQGFHHLAVRAEGIKWKPCGEDGSRECGRFEVPLDYQNATAGKASLAVARFRATLPPKMGTLFVNPGGPEPGGSGVDMILSDRAEVIMETAGGKYDVVSWDPRGIGRTRPKVGRCFQTGEQEIKFWNGTIPLYGIEAKGNFTDPADLKAFYDQVPQVDVLLKKIGEQCIATTPNTYEYVGTAAAVRDMVAMNDLLEGPNKTVDFWGFSYGTVIGVYFANMFPDRVGRVVLDGVVDPEIWANRPAHELWNRTMDSVDKAFDGFVAACAAAGPNGCAMAPKNSAPESVKQNVLGLIDRAYEFRKTAGPYAELSSAYVRTVLFNGLYRPTEWPKLAKTLKSMSNFLDSPKSSSERRKRSVRRPRIQIRRDNRQNNNGNRGNGDDWNINDGGNGNRNGNDGDGSRNRDGNGSSNWYWNGSGDGSGNGGNGKSGNRNGGNAIDDPPSRDYATYAITCADAADAGNVTTKLVFDSLVDSARTASPVFGQQWGDAGLYCHNWPVRAVERFTGPFNKTLSNKIIVIGNEADPATPFLSAKNVADALGDSAILIEQDDFGHLSLAMRSDCTQGALTDYFLSNTLPTSDKFCETDQALFSGIDEDTLLMPPPELDKARPYRRSRRTVITVVVAVAFIVVLTLILWIGKSLLSRKNKAAAPVTHVTP